jgi:N-acetylmuramoyl-L-alanine amidase
VKGSSLVDRFQASPNHEPRLGEISLLVLHYTGMETGQRAIDWLCNPVSKVSCHYLIDVDGTIVQMVDEDRRAWHAGTSCWHGVSDINSASIGIEIQNLGHGGGCPAFPQGQMERVAALSLDIMARHNISPHQVTAHSDVAPGRKIDPGEAFDWHFLALCGIGQMVISTGNPVYERSIRDVQTDLTSLGYGIEPSGNFDDRTRIVIEAFQRRYRPSEVTGTLDAQTLDILRRLVAVQAPV